MQTQFNTIRLFLLTIIRTVTSILKSHFISLIETYRQISDTYSGSFFNYFTLCSDPVIEKFILGKGS